MPDWKEEIGRRLSGLRLPPAREAEIIEELAQHLDDRYEQSLQGGATTEEAYQAALLELTRATGWPTSCAGSSAPFGASPWCRGHRGG